MMRLVYKDMIIFDIIKHELKIGKFCLSKSSLSFFKILRKNLENPI